MAIVRWTTLFVFLVTIRAREWYLEIVCFFPFLPARCGFVSVQKRHMLPSYPSLSVGKKFSNDLEYLELR